MALTVEWHRADRGGGGWGGGTKSGVKTKELPFVPQVLKRIISESENEI
jgi:hypothetical protein